MSAPEDDNRTVWIVLALIVSTVLALHHEVIFGGRVYHMDDAADGYYPCHVAIARAYAHGQLPDWERGAATGWPLVVDPYYGPFYPGGALFGIFGAARGLGVQIVLHTILCGLGALLLLRRRGLSTWPAAFGAISLCLSSFLVCRIRHIIFPEGLAWLTFALAGAEGFIATRRRRELVMIALAVGLTLLSGALPLLPFFAIFSALYVAPRLRPSSSPLRYALAIGLAASVGLLLACAQLLPTLLHLKYSPRAMGTSYEFASSYAWPGAQYIATLLVPDIFGVEDRARWFGAFNHWEMAAYYVGLWALCLAPIAFMRRRDGIRLEASLLWFALVLGVLLAFGDATPVHRFFYGHVPLYAALRCPTRALVMTMLAACVLGAEALQAIVEREWTRKDRFLFGVVFWPLVGGGIAYALWHTQLFHHGKGAIPAGELETRHAFAHFAVVLSLGLALLFLARSGRARLVGPLFALLAIGDLFISDRGYVQPQPADYVEGTDRFQAVQWLLEQKSTDRFALDPRGPFRLHNLGMTYDLEGATAYSSVQLFRYVNFLEILATGHGLPTPLKSDPAATDVRRFDTPLVDLLDVRWVISDHSPARGYVQRFAPRQDDKGPASKHEPMWDRRLGVWENPNPMPRAFVVHAVDLQTTEAGQAASLARLDPRKTALVEEAVVVEPGPLEPATIVERGRDRVVIEATATSRGLLVLSDAWYPGWTATVDGKPAPILRVDYAFRGISLATGKHRVEMRYASNPLRLGLVLSLFGIVGTLALGLARRRRTGGDWTLDTGHRHQTT